MWEKEDIPDKNCLFLRVPTVFIDGEDIGADAFLNGKDDAGIRTNSLSSNWDKYSSAESTRDQVVKYGRDPRKYGVAEIVVADIRTKIIISPQEVIHEPDDDNRAHSHINGPKEFKVREQFAGSIAKLCVKPELIKS